MRRHSASVREILVAMLVAIILALFVRTFLIQAFRIPSSSMAPGLRVGDHILVNKFVFGDSAWLLPQRPVRRGDVVLFRFPLDPRRIFVKRCVALPGDVVEIREGRLWRDGRAQDETAYLHPRSPAAGAVHQRFGPLQIPPGHYFCLGDHRSQSSDSRAWGPLPAGYLKGRALLIYWSVAPPARDDSVAADSAPVGIWVRLKAFLMSPGRLVMLSRWERCLTLVR